MPDRLQTYTVQCGGGLITNEDTLTRGAMLPGSARKLTNYEPGLKGGYSRIEGYTKWNPDVVPGEGAVLGVTPFQGTSIAARKVVGASEYDLYKGSSVSWGTAINGATVLTSPSGNVRFNQYAWTTPVVIITDGTNTHMKYDGTTFSQVTGTGVPADPTYAEEYKGYLFLSGYSSNTSAVTFSQPNDDTLFDPALGAGELIVGDEVVGLKKFRDRLYIFCTNRLYYLAGTSKADFAVVPVSDSIGCISPDSIQEIAGDVVYLAPDGIRTVSGTDKIGDVSLENLSQVIFPDIVDLIKGKDPLQVRSVINREKSQCRFFFSTASETAANSQGVLMGLGRNPTNGQTAWEWAKMQGFHVACSDSNIWNATEYIFHGTFDGYVMRQEQGSSFDGASVPTSYHTPYLGMEDNESRKTLYKITLYYTVEGNASINMQTKFDYGTSDSMDPPKIIFVEGEGLFVYGDAGTVYGTFTYGSTTTPIDKQNLMGSGFTSSFEFTTSDTNPIHNIQGFTVQYIKNGRR